MKYMHICHEANWLWAKTYPQKWKTKEEILFCLHLWVRKKITFCITDQIYASASCKFQPSPWGEKKKKQIHKSGQYLQNQIWNALKQKSTSLILFLSWKHSIIHEPWCTILGEGSPPNVRRLAFLGLVNSALILTSYVTVKLVESSYL